MAGIFDLNERNKIVRGEAFPAARLLSASVRFLKVGKTELCNQTNSSMALTWSFVYRISDGILCSSGLSI
jgi:hypothetical protein